MWKNYDHVPRGTPCRVVQEHGVDGPSWNGVGLWENCPLPLLTISLDRTPSSSRVRERVRIRFLRISSLLFADDTVLLALSIAHPPALAGPARTWKWSSWDESPTNWPRLCIKLSGLINQNKNYNLDKPTPKNWVSSFIWNSCHKLTLNRIEKKFVAIK